jgi:1-acyl-sn-glycerol-3-phosphate acyltransferase
MKRQTKLTGPFSSVWVFTITVLSTLKTCVKILLLRDSSKTGFRAKVDKILVSWGRRLLAILSAKISIKGAENIYFEKGRAHMIMCSHTSNYDIPATFAVIPGSIRMMAKKELKKLPVFGHAITRSEMPFINRSDRKDALKDLAYAKAKMEDGIILWVAPEGTRTAGANAVGRLKKGGFHLALSTDAIIHPIAFRGIHDLQLLKKIKWTLNKDIECHIGKPIDCRNYNKKNLNQLMQLVESEFKILVGQTNSAAIVDSKD